jgi:hypothetical protein
MTHGGAPPAPDELEVETEPPTPVVLDVVLAATLDAAASDAGLVPPMAGQPLPAPGEAPPAVPEDPPVPLDEDDDAPTERAARDGAPAEQARPMQRITESKQTGARFRMPPHRRGARASCLAS